MRLRHLAARALAISHIGILGCADADPTPRTSTCELVAQGYGPAGTTAVSYEEVVGGLEVPWALAWLPDGRMLISERPGRIRRLEPDGSLTTLATIPLGASAQEGGLLGLAVHPEVGQNNWFYLYFTTRGTDGLMNVVERWRLDGDTATFDRRILDGIPALQFHNGGRIRFGPDGHLYVGTGDAGEPNRSQDPDDLGGKILRITDEGLVPDDNPFSRSATWVLGVRNTQGFDWREDGALVMTDHGPSGLPYEGGRSGHDELNLVEPGDNLGWPERYACEEGLGLRPSVTWTNALPPGGTAIYQGDQIPEWQGDVLIGALGVGLGIGHIQRVRLADDGTPLLREAYFQGELGRIREVVMGPDGSLYFTTSNCDGRGQCGDGDGVYRVVPTATTTP